MLTGCQNLFYMRKLTKQYFGFCEQEPIEGSNISIEEFLALLRSEEDYFKKEVVDTKLMLTRLRKIFYDRYGWNKYLIRGTASVKGRYKVTLVAANNIQDGSDKTADAIRKSSNNGVSYQTRVVEVRKRDWMNPNAGTVPKIYKDNHQEVKLSNNLICDIGHVLAGMDAANHPEPVAPLPTFLLKYFYRFLPHIKRNIDAATWIGDLSSTTGEYLFDYLSDKGSLTNKKKQSIIDQTSPPADMLGNIDGYVVSASYNIAARNGQRVSDILKDYYLSSRRGAFQNHRFQVFCEQVGLEGWNGYVFTNEEKWIRSFTRQLRNCTAFYAYTRFSKPKGLWLALGIYLRIYDPVIECNKVIHLFLEELKRCLVKENAEDILKNTLLFSPVAVRPSFAREES